MSLNPTRLTLEELDARTMPSISITLPHVPTTTVTTLPAHPLHGTASGHYTGNTLMVDAGVYDHFTGTAHLGGRGSFGLTGWVQGIGFMTQGHASGQLVLTNAHGTITLTLHGPLQPGFSPIPSHFHYTISGATGSYQHLSGSGQVGVALLPAPTAFGQPPQGMFNLTFS